MRVVFAWLIADGGMHLKNMAVLKIGEPGNPAFRSVRLASGYDTLTTRVFPRLEHDRMALKLGGKGSMTFWNGCGLPLPRSLCPSSPATGRPARLL